MDETIVTDGTSIAQVPLYSKVVGLKMQLNIRGSVTTPPIVRWMLCKNPDGDYTAGNFMTAFQSAADDATTREIRGLTLAKGMVMLNESSGVSRLPVFVRRATLKRLGSLRENDRLELVLACSGAPATNPTLSGFGQIYCRLN